MVGVVGKIRSPWAVLGLGIITLGIYSIFWQYAIFKEMKDYSGTGIGGGLGLVFAIFLGIANVFLMPSEVGNLYAAEGQTKPVTGVTGLWALLPIVGGLVWLWKVQGHLNQYWLSHGATKA